MSQLKLYILLVLSSLQFSVLAQDIHWSQFNDNQIFQNPGNTGNFDGDYRIIANYRSQWKSVTVPFNTLSFSGDTRFEKNQKIGLGMLFFNDASGDGKFQTTEIQFNTSYTIYLTKDSSHFIRPGLNLGMNHRQVNWNQFSFDNQYNGAYYDPTLPTNEIYQSQRNTNISIGIGTVYEFQKTNRKKITGGISFFNLNRPNQGFFGENIPRDIPIYFGTWIRNKDAGYLSMGMDYQNWFFGISYDFNFSKLVPASNVRGGIEFAARYIIKRFKPKKIVHRVCPDYI